MSAFKFRLQSVLELASTKSAKSPPSSPRPSRPRMRRVWRRRRCETIRQTGSQALRSAHASEPTIGQLKTIGYVIEQLNHHIVDAQSRVEEAEQLVTQARTDLTSALQARRVLSRLRDRHFDTWRAEGNAQEMKQMDELALTRFTRRDDSGNNSGAASA